MSKTLILNMANIVSDDKAIKLQEDDFNNTSERSLDLYINHNNELISIGYERDALVWFSQTNLADLFLSRRVFECVKQGCFYRSVPFGVMLESVYMNEKDLQYMCYARLDGIKTDEPTFSGCLTGSAVGGLTGVDFAETMSVTTMRLRSFISKIGSESEILNELEKDYRYLTDVYDSGSGFDIARHMKVDAIIAKWRGAECLKLCSRATIRQLYRDVCYFTEKFTNLQTEGS